LGVFILAWTDATLTDILIKAIHFNEIREACDNLDNTECWSHNSTYRGTHYGSHYGSYHYGVDNPYYNGRDATLYVTYCSEHYVSHLYKHGTVG
jgi:hypothetical protein